MFDYDIYWINCSENKVRYEHMRALLEKEFPNNKHHHVEAIMHKPKYNGITMAHMVAIMKGMTSRKPFLVVEDDIGGNCGGNCRSPLTPPCGGNCRSPLTPPCQEDNKEKEKEKENDKEKEKENDKEKDKVKDKEKEKENDKEKEKENDKEKEKENDKEKDKVKDKENDKENDKDKDKDKEKGERNKTPDAIYLGLSYWGNMKMGRKKLLAECMNKDEKVVIINNKVFMKKGARGEDWDDNFFRIRDMYGAHAILYINKQYMVETLKICIMAISMNKPHDIYLPKLQKKYLVLGQKHPWFYQLGKIGGQETGTNINFSEVRKITSENL